MLLLSVHKVKWVDKILKFNKYSQETFSLKLQIRFYAAIEKISYELSCILGKHSQDGIKVVQVAWKALKLKNLLRW